MIELDAQEEQALTRFIGLLVQERFEGHPVVDRDRVSRGLEGQIIVPVAVPAEKPDVHMAMLMARKAEQLYRQAGCRFLLAQTPTRDPKRGTYVWAEGAWRPLP